MIGLWASLVFYNSYLPDVAYPEQQDRASARGFSMAIGSVLLLFNLSMVMMPDLYGIEGTSGEAAMKAMRYSFVSVGVWWFCFSRFFTTCQKEIKMMKKITRDIFGMVSVSYARSTIKWLEITLKRYLTFLSFLWLYKR